MNNTYPEVFDEKKNLVKVGSEVTFTTDLNDVALVTFISDWDGDVDDEGRSYIIAPRVTIQFSDGEIMVLPTYNPDGEESVCEDILVVQ